MKNILPFTMVMSACLAVSALASDAPDLKGTWKAEYPVHHHNGTGQSAQAIIIEHQTAEGFRGVREWKRTEFVPAAHAKEPEVKTGKVAFAGVIGFDGKTLHMADFGQNGFTEAVLTGPDEMEVIFLHSGDPAVAFRAKFKRVK